MRVYGVDFTSAPRRGKQITCSTATLAAGKLIIEGFERWPDFTGFERFLVAPGPWIAGFDFPFGLPRRFIANIGWPTDWHGYIRHVTGLGGRQAFRDALDHYRRDRPAGDREHRRDTDRAAGSISPQKIYGVPVGLMFYEGVPRLLNAGVTIPALHAGDPARIAVEAYPGALARHLIGRTSYKNDAREKQTERLASSRYDMMERILTQALRASHGLHIELSSSLAALACEDASGDHLDALLCAIQAGWAWNRRHENYGFPPQADRNEGWISEPTLIPSHSA